MTERSPAELRKFKEFWADELAAAELYDAMADVAGGERAEVFRRLADVERRHAEHWADILREEGASLDPPRTSLRSRLLMFMARRFGIDSIIPVVIRAEAADRDKYLAIAEAPASMAAQEAEHGLAIARMVTEPTGARIALSEGRHRTGAGGALRAAVFGANDGLVSNFALIMGVAGAAVGNEAVFVAGVAGLVAGAGSMAAGEWISVRSQTELYEREIAVEAHELEHFPEEEQEELELIYRAKGIAPAEAAELAEKIMADPSTALDTLAREELGLDPGALASPWTAAISSFLAFAVGAAVPVLPFLFTSGRPAIVAAAALAAMALLLVGAIISVFTGRSALLSGLRMVLIGGAAALVTFGIGSLVGITLD